MRKDKTINKVSEIALYGILLPAFIMTIYASIFKNNLTVLLFGSSLAFIASFLIFNYNKPISKEPIRLHEAILYILFTLLILVAINIFLKYIMDPKSTQESKEIIMSLPRWLTILIAVVLAPISEELFFRQGFYNLIGDNKFLYILLNSSLFALAHFQAGDTVTTAYILINSFIFGTILSGVHYKTKNIFIPIITHTLLNLIAIFF